MDGQEEKAARRPKLRGQMIDAVGTVTHGTVDVNPAPADPVLGPARSCRRRLSTDEIRRLVERCGEKIDGVCDTCGCEYPGFLTWLCKKRYECETCGQIWANELGERFRAAIRGVLRATKRPDLYKIVHLVFTVPQPGNLPSFRVGVQDGVRKATEGWGRLRKWFDKRFGNQSRKRVVVVARLASRESKRAPHIHWHTLLAGPQGIIKKLARRWEDSDKLGIGVAEIVACVPATRRDIRNELEYGVLNDARERPSPDDPDFPKFRKRWAAFLRATGGGKVLRVINAPKLARHKRLWNENCCQPACTGEIVPLDRTIPKYWLLPRYRVQEILMGVSAWRRVQKNATGG